jgi:hypothetical protein
VDPLCGADSFLGYSDGSLLSQRPQPRDHVTSFRTLDQRPSPRELQLGGILACLSANFFGHLGSCDLGHLVFSLEEPAERFDTWVLKGKASRRFVMDGILRARLDARDDGRIIGEETGYDVENYLQDLRKLLLGHGLGQCKYVFRMLREL